jgi:hypothetical protein
MSTYTNVPPDLLDKSPHVNFETTEYSQILKAYFPKKDGLFICLRCEWVQDKNDKCGQCGTPNFRRVNKTTRIYPPEKRSIAHYLRQVKMCWTADQDPNNLDLVKYHPFEEKTRLVINLGTQEAHQETYCSVCQRVYGWPSGRAATAEEIADARAGKIPLKTVKPVGGEVDSA